MSKQSDIENTLEDLNKYLAPNFVHTFQFVSIDERQPNRLVWRTCSLQKGLYKQASIRFTGFQESDRTIQRTLLRSDYLEGPFWYYSFGDAQILRDYTPPVYEFEDSPNEGLKESTDSITDYHQLLKFWQECLRDVFGSRGATMWVSQPHSQSGASRIVSSVFAVFNEPIGSEPARYGAAKRLRDFIINYLIGVYKDLVESHYKILERNYEELLSSDSSRVYISSQLEERLKLLKPVISSGVPILVTGETGTGRTVVARKLHGLSSRLEGSFQIANCPRYVDEPSTFSSLLLTNGSSLLEKNRKGTLVFDDVHTCTRPMQNVLIELLAKLSASTLDSPSDTPLDCRLIFTADVDLHEQVVNGIFSEDLYYRINTFEVALPPLRSRKAELRMISETILKELSKRYPTVSGEPKSLSDAALKELEAYDYPGNYRELYNILIRAFLLSVSSDASIEANDIRL